MFGKIKKVLLVEGMHCEHCAQKVKQVLEQIDEITSVKVNLKKQEVEMILNKNIDDEKLKQAFKDLDYTLLQITTK